MADTQGHHPRHHSTPTATWFLTLVITTTVFLLLMGLIVTTGFLGLIFLTSLIVISNHIWLPISAVQFVGVCWGNLGPRFLGGNLGEFYGVSGTSGGSNHSGQMGWTSPKAGMIFELRNHGLVLDSRVLNWVLEIYLELGSIDYAEKVFDKICERGACPWLLALIGEFHHNRSLNYMILHTKNLNYMGLN